HRLHAPALHAPLPQRAAGTFPPARGRAPFRTRRAHHIRALHEGNVRRHPTLGARAQLLRSRQSGQRRLRRGGRRAALGRYFAGGAATSTGPAAYSSIDTRHVRSGNEPPCTCVPPRFVRISPGSSTTPCTSSFASRTASMPEAP